MWKMLTFTWQMVLYPLKSSQSAVAVPSVDDALDGSKYSLNPAAGIGGCVSFPLL